MARHTDTAKTYAVVIAVILIFVFITLGNSIRIIDPGFVGIVVRLGEAQPKELGEGIHAVIPFITVVKPLDVRIQKADVKTDAASKDLQTVKASIVVNYRIDKTRAVTLYREIGITYVATVIEPAIQEAFKAGSAKYTAESLITERSLVSTGIKESISSRLQPFGVVIDAVNITNFEFSPEFNKAIEDKMTAEQRALQAQKELERFRFEALQKVETAKGEAESIMERAKAQAESLNLKSKYATQTLVWLTAVEKWDGKLPTHLFAAPPAAVFDVNDGKSPDNLPPQKP
ncbi:MAG: prohibitin family protein [Planctomycetaceae bacterium]|jgi:regulator of protease activity HflC (stomatin/prohibitin superfamily)|nr:prohibitin family protein [Planctomycetaceae bacterium]